MKKNIYCFIFIILCQNLFARDPSFIDKRKYPNRKGIKGLQPDFQTIREIIGNEVHNIVINFVWSSWQPNLK